MRASAWRLGAWLGWALASLTVAGFAAAAGWGGITPGETTRREVEARFGRPTRERAIVQEGRTVPETTYVGDRAPKGVERMVVSFGLLRPDGFAPDVVRALTLYLRPGVFRVEAVVIAWGKPDSIGTEEQTGRPTLLYETQGLLILLDRDGRWAEVMVLAPDKRASKTQ